jgi:K+-sensing histidine kinase KdpD
MGFVAEAAVVSALGLALVACLLLFTSDRAPEGSTGQGNIADVAALVEELGYSLDRQFIRLTYTQERVAEAVVERVIAATSSTAIDRGVRPDSLRLVREISHSLGTPLAGIKAQVNVLKLRGHVNEDGGTRLDQIRTAVDLCQAYILAYRNLGIVDDSTTFLADDRLTSAISRALDFYGTHYGREIVSAVAVPDSLPGYSIYQLLSAILPLLENAVEGAADERVAVEHSKVGRSDAIRISNAIAGGLAANFLEDGVSGKGGRHQGLGIGVSRRLVESMGGTLIARSVGTRLEMVVQIPSKVEDG